MLKPCNPLFSKMLHLYLNVNFLKDSPSNNSTLAHCLSVCLFWLFMLNTRVTFETVSNVRWCKILLAGAFAGLGKLSKHSSCFSTIVHSKLFTLSNNKIIQSRVQIRSLAKQKTESKQRAHLKDNSQEFHFVVWQLTEQVNQHQLLSYQAVNSLSHPDDHERSSPSGRQLEPDSLPARISAVKF